MSKILKIPPTKSNLLQLKKRVAFLEQGHTLLERKKDLLTRLVYERLADYRRLRGEARADILHAYQWLALAHLRVDNLQWRRLGWGMNPALTVEILPRSSIGVQYPSVSAHCLPLEPLAVMGSDASFDEARKALAQMAVTLAHLGEAETALWRLLEEQRKTQKRVNALKYNVIPRYRTTIHAIQAALEEEERNTLFQIKILQGMQRDHV
jgi:V/A-type H+/Na+-transporting ATPase subunit D